MLWEAPERRIADAAAVGPGSKGVRHMTSNTLAWLLSVALFAIYLSLLFTVCSLTFRKGYTVLGIVGIFFPILWLVGAVLPAKRGSRHDIEEAARYQAMVTQGTR
jgi:hypothetical protein